MENNQELWGRCLSMIRENISKDVRIITHDDAAWVYDTWFAPIALESFDAATGALSLRVPDRHVCDYIEHYRMGLWSWALRSVFGQQVRLSYHILQPSPDHPEGFLSAVLPGRAQFSVPDARQKVEDGLRRVVGDGCKWLDAYDKIADWLSDNKGRGLLVVGTPGMGKSEICCNVLPPILGGPEWQKKITVVRAGDMRQRIDELKRARCVIIDDLGKEPRKHYGDTDQTFFDLCEASVQGGPLLIITTNLSTTPVQPQFRDRYSLSIQERYGSEVLDRLKTITKMVRIEGKSLRPVG